MVSGLSIETAERQVAADLLLMFGNRLPPVGIGLDDPGVHSQLKGDKSQNLVIDFQRLLARKPAKDPYKNDLVRKPQPNTSPGNFPSGQPPANWRQGSFAAGKRRGR